MLSQNLVFSADLAQSRYYLLQINDQFQELLKKEGYIRISSQYDQRVQFFSDTETFSIVKINVPTTLLIVDPMANILKYSNSYLNVVKCKPNQAIIFEGLREMAITETDYRLSKLEEIEKRTISYTDLCLQYKISPKYLREFMELANFAQINGDWLPISYKLFNFVMHQTINKLTEMNAFDREVQVYNMAGMLYVPVHEQVLEAVLNKFKCYKVNDGYLVTAGAIVRFVLNEMALIKPEYFKGEFDTIFKKLLDVYFPANFERKANWSYISERFLDIRDGAGTYQRYDVFMLPTTAPELVQYLSKVKMRYTYDEAINLFRLVYRGKNIEYALIKHFRKYARDYEIKAILE